MASEKWEVTVDGEGRRRYWFSGQELSESDWVNAYRDQHGVPPNIAAIVASTAAERAAR